MNGKAPQAQLMIEILYFILQTFDSFAKCLTINQF